MATLNPLARATRWLAVALALAAVLALVLAKLVLQAEPLPQTKPGQRASGVAQHVQRLLNREQFRQLLTGQPVALRLAQSDLAPVMSDVAARTLGGGAHLSLGQGQAEVQLSLPLANTPWHQLSWLGAWLNLSVTARQTPTGPPDITGVRLGALPLPTTGLWWLADQISAHYQAAGSVAIAQSAIQQVRLAPSGVQAQIHWDATLRARTLAALVPEADRARMQFYQGELARAVAPPANAPAAAAAAVPPVPAAPLGYLPLIDVLRPLFGAAHQRSLGQALTTESREGEGAALRENRAALLVLTLYALQIPLNEVLPNASAWPRPVQRELTLHGRQDFAQHYLLSALLAADVGGRLTNLVALYKEVSDRAEGSGFSFNDIAADRAGILFGQRARLEPAALQARVGEGQTDQFFMPSVADLPEYLSPSEFQRQFGQVGSPAYNRLLDDIDQRLASLEVLQ